MRLWSRWKRQGWGRLRPPNGNLPLKAVSVHTRIAGVLAETTLEQTFKNCLKEAVEATYIFPLPANAGVTSFIMRVGERVVEGVLEERQKAREQYDEAIRQGYCAAITEQERPNVFSLRVGNLMPGDEAHITFKMAHTLQIDWGTGTADTEAEHRSVQVADAMAKYARSDRVAGGADATHPAILAEHPARPVSRRAGRPHPPGPTGSQAKSLVVVTLGSCLCGGSSRNVKRRDASLTLRMTIIMSPGAPRRVSTQNLLATLRDDAKSGSGYPLLPRCSLL